MRSIRTRGPAQAATRDGNSGNRRAGAESTSALLAAATRPDPEVAEKPQRRLCVRVTPRSAKSKATGFDVIAGPRSALLVLLLLVSGVER